MKKQSIFTMGLMLLVISMTAQSAVGLTATSGVISDGINIDHAVENIEFQAHYEMNNAFGTTWKVTGNKAIDIELDVTSQPSGTTILVEHMHADIVIESTKSSFDEITQDSMDDKLHASLDGGFFINETYGYEEVFSIEGSSPTFQSSCQIAWTGWYGTSESNTFKFSEEALIEDYDVYGTTLFIVYDILIKNTGDEYFHKVIIVDNIFIDTDGNVEDNTGNVTDLPSTDGIPGFPIGITLLIVGMGIVGILWKIKKR